MPTRVFLVLIGLGAVSACANLQSSLPPRASFDLKCPEPQLQITKLSGMCNGLNGDPCTMGVTGCGQQATYVFVDGAWVMNNARSPGK